MTNLKAEPRDTSAKLADLRKAGKLPAVFYGKKEPSTPISISMVDFMKVWKEAGESSVISLQTPSGAVESLIHEIDFDPVSGVPRHADFYVFEKGHKVEVEIPLEFEGVSPAIKDLGGTLVKVVHALKIEAMPKDLPHNIVVDISSLSSFESQILAKDLKLPAGVLLKVPEDEVIALVSAPREEKEEEVAPVDLSAIEVEKKGKDEEAAASEGEAKAE
ncbi:MAG: ribosomal rRNA E-loop binding protein Ctc/L25/TL5, large subunit ribosomal protein [Parcubacteria group bacterium]|nr:ribosomal rRNA E-loop binding protein Ctc/L25/TL5, large subunit ribosomal protein [Parcubacteria group bacterium]